MAQTVKHPECDGNAFYVPAFPVGRGIKYFDAQDENGLPLAAGTVVFCQNCGEKVKFSTINAYYTDDEE